MREHEREEKGGKDYSVLSTKGESFGRECGRSTCALTTVTLGIGSGARVRPVMLGGVISPSQSSVTS